MPFKNANLKIIEGYSQYLLCVLGVEVYMKFKRIIIVVIFILGFISGYGIVNINKDRAVISDNYKIASKNNALTMMLETDIDSNEYEVATSIEWPTSGYIFNAEMSACERGGTLSWDSENNRVVMASGSADKCYVYFDRYTTVSITNVTASNITNSSITLMVEATVFDSPITNYYYSKDNGLSYEESTSNTYTFSGLEQGAEYNFKVYAVDSNGVSSNIYSLRASTKDIIYLADYIKDTVYTGTDGDNGLYYHDGSGSYTNAAQEAGDNSYRYAGANPNNYVCFASDAASCPNDNLYRIIGVFGDQVKLIKNTSLGNYYWSGSSSNRRNTWSNSTLNTGTLNGTYLNGLGTTWSAMIETTTWKVGGGNYSRLRDSRVKTAYNYELGNNSSSTTYNAKIGLMYVSDYGYAASPANWRTTLINYDNDTNRNNNWMYIGGYDWTISRYSDNATSAFVVNNSGSVSNLYVYYNFADGYGLGVRPSFYLYPWVGIESGNGSVESPYRLTLPELVEFSFAGTTYYLEDGMTWEEWVNSIYNVDGLVVSEGNIFNSTLTSKLSITGSGEFIKATDVIDYNNSSTWYWYNI